MQSIETAVIVVNWNGKKYLKDCFDSLERQTYKNFKTIFVDNGSEDGSVEYVRENYPEAEIKEISHNVGFAAGYNLGFRLAMKDDNIKWIIALNNDTKLDDNYLEEIISCAKRHLDAGSIQLKVLNFSEPEKIDCTGIVIARDGTAHNRGYGEIDKGQYENEEEIFGANATAVLYTRESLEKTKMPNGNFFDRDHFAYYEDVDLAWRMRLAGFKSFYCPRAIVYHVHSGTAGKASLMKAYHLHRNYFFTIIKNYPCCLTVKTLFWRFLSYLQLVANVFRKKKRETEFVKDYSKGRVAVVILQAWGSVIVNLPRLLKKRCYIQKNRVVKTREIREWVIKYKAD